MGTPMVIGVLPRVLIVASIAFAPFSVAVSQSTLIRASDTTMNEVWKSCIATNVRRGVTDEVMGIHCYRKGEEARADELRWLWPTTFLNLILKLTVLWVIGYGSVEVVRWVLAGAAKKSEDAR